MLRHSALEEYKSIREYICAGLSVYNFVWIWVNNLHFIANDNADYDNRLFENANKTTNINVGQKNCNEKKRIKNKIVQVLNANLFVFMEFPLKYNKI